MYAHHMKKFLIIFLLFPLSVFSAKISGNWDATVIRIIDGDTFTAKVHLGDQHFATVSVRIKGIDTPEKNGECEEEKQLAQKAKLYLIDVLDTAENKVKIVHALDGKYANRVVAEIKINGESLSEILLKKTFVRKYQGKKRLGWCD